MGYRHHMYAIDKSVVEEIKDLSIKELIERFMPEDEQDYFYHGNLPTEEIHDLGKYIEFAEDIKATGHPLFSNEETREETEEYDIYVIGKEGFIKLIDIYKNYIIKHYTSMLTDDDEDDYSIFEPKTAKEKQENHIKSMIREWQTGTSINISDKREAITHSWKYEYIIFELVRKLKIFDFENKAILFYGW